MKRFVSVILVFFILFSLFPTAFADGGADVQAQSSPYVQCQMLEDGTVLSVPVSPKIYESERNGLSLAGESSLPRVATPTNLTWHETVPGDISFDLTGNEDTVYEITVYKDGECHETWHHAGLDHAFGERATTSFSGYIIESGVYYFTVVALGDGITTSDSEVARSDDFIYTRPSTALGVPTSLRLEDGIAYYSAAGGAGGYIFTIYLIEEGEYIECFSIYPYLEADISDVAGESGEEIIGDGAFSQDGYYVFTMQALSSDINRTANGAVSDYSSSWYYEKPSSYTGKAIDAFAAITSDITMVLLYVEVEGSINDTDEYWTIDMTPAQVNSLLGKTITFKKDDDGLIYDVAPVGNKLKTVTFSLNYSGGGTYKTQYVEPNAYASRPPDPVRSGYVFKGWYANKSLTGNAWNFTQNTVSNNMTLYAKWEATGFRYQRDSFEFLNSYSNYLSDYYEIRPSDYALLLAQYSDYSDRAYIKSVKEGTWGGSCFGMSSVACMAATENLAIKNYDPLADVVFDMSLTKNFNGDADVGKVESLINYYHLMQLGGDVRAVRSDYSSVNHSDNLRAIVDKLRVNDCVVLGFNLNDAAGRRLGGHAVVAYGMTYDEASGIYTIKIYDCSQNQQVFYLYITDSHGNYTAQCDEWEAEWGSDFFFKYAVTVSELRAEAQLFSLGYEEPSSFLETNYDSFTISDGVNSVVVTDGVIPESPAIGIVDYGPQNEVGNPLSLLFGLPVLATGSYTVTPVEDRTITTYSTVIMNNDGVSGFYGGVNANAAARVTVSASGAVTTACENGATQTVRTALNNPVTPWYYTEVTGTSAGISVIPLPESTTISAANNSLVSITAGSDFSSLTFDDIDASGSGVSVTQDGDGNCTVVKIETSAALQRGELGFSVVFDSVNGSNVAALVNISAGSLILPPEDPTKEGYIFGGWYKDASYGNLWDFDTDTVTEDIVLYAAWDDDPDYFKTVRLEVNGCDDQIFFVTSGMKLTANQLGIDGYSDMDVDWNEDLDYGIVVGEEDINVSGVATPKGNGETLYFGSPTLENGMLHISISNEAVADFEVFVVAAAYASSGRMLAIQTATPTSTARGTQNLYMDFSSLAGAAHYKVFLFNNDSGSYVPLCTCAGYPV